MNQSFNGIKLGKICQDCKRWFSEEDAERMEYTCSCGGKLK